ncbi:Dolichyl-diphosphooligosaccharide--protein glycosyltransferase subunit 1, partial [Caligus rogercresseyi]
NNGKGSVDTFLVSLPAGIAPRLAYISCSTKKTHLVVREASLKDHSGAFWSIPGTSVALELKMVLAHALRNFPAEILQKREAIGGQHHHLWSLSSLTTPFTYEALRVHYENNRPFLSISNMERVLELSMWGNIAVTETLDVRHTGAKLKGSFSRYEYQRENSGASSVKAFKTYLPSS